MIRLTPLLFIATSFPALGQASLVPVLPVFEGPDFFPVAQSLSFDGSTVLVTARRAEFFGARQATFIQRLGDRPEFVDVAPGFGGSAVDGSGSQIAGFTVAQPMSRLTRWDLGVGEIDSGLSGLSFAISGDGTTVVGGAFDIPGVAVSSLTPVRWVLGSSPTVLLNPGPLDTGAASAVSADGNIVVGSINHLLDPITPTGSTGFLWEAPGSITRFNAGADYTVVQDVTADGSMVVGHSFDQGAPGALMPFLWSRTAGFITLAPLPGTWSSASFEAVADDGSLAAGHFIDGSTGLFKPFVWTPTGGFVALFGASTGLVDPEPASNVQVNALSGDGNVLALQDVTATDFVLGDVVSWLAILSPLAASTVSVGTCASSGPNSSGALGTCEAFGSAIASVNDLELRGASLPPFQTAMFIIGTEEAATPLGGGTLCLGGSLGRVVSSLASVGPAGTLRERLDLLDLPLSTGSVPVLSGETFHFQVWHRDTPAFGGTNLSGACRVTFL